MIEARELLADAAGDILERIGKRRVLGKVWAVLFLTEGVVDAGELRDILGISSGSLSMALNELIDMGLVERVTREHERRYYYRCETEMWSLLTRVFRQKLRPQVVSLLEKIRRAEDLLESSVDDGDSYALEQARHLTSLGAFTLDLLDAFMERTKVEVKAAQKWLSVSGKLGGEPLSRLRKRINAARNDKK